MDEQRTTHGVIWSIYKTVYSCNYFLSKILTKLAGIVIIGMSIIIFAQVIMRYVFNSPFEWAEELTIYLMVYLTFICLPYLILLNKNISMTFIYDFFAGKKIQYIFDIMIISSVLVFLYLWLPQSIKMFIAGKKVSAYQLPINRSAMLIVVPVSFIFSSIIAIQKCIKSVVGLCSPSLYHQLSIMEDTYHDKNDKIIEIQE